MGYDLGELFEKESFGEIKQYENWIIATCQSSGERPNFQVFDLDTWKKVDLSYWEDTTMYQNPDWHFDYHAWYVFDGNIYYIPYNFQSIHRIALSSGRDESVYVLDEAVYPNHMIEDFKIRDDGTIMAVIRNVEKNDNGAVMYSEEMLREYHRHHIEFWMIPVGGTGTTEQKIWESDIYAFVYSVDFNRQGFFFDGGFATRSYSEEYDGFMWIKENGEMERLESRSEYTSRVGIFYLTESAYYLVDRIEDPESMIWNPDDGDEYVFRVDAVTKYDFEGNELGTYRLVDEKVLEEGWYLLDIICYNDEITAFYAKDNADELYISQIRVE